MAKQLDQSEPAKVRLRREDCDRVKHDSLFSDWKILVGASDWRDHAVGKEGVSRYRLHNLPSPNHSLPGVYELGVFPRTKNLVNGGNKPSRRIRREDVLAVYVGEAENVRQRLQRYGQAGSHLEAGFVTVKIASSCESVASAGAPMVQVVSQLAKCAASETSYPPAQNGALQGHQLFSRVFAEGRSIAFRWALTESKEAAKRVEQELLSVFDYAWNREKNGFRRPHDVFSKLHLGEDSSKVSCYGALSYLAYLKWILSGRQSRGIMVAVSNPKEVLKQQEMITSSVLKASDSLQLNETWERKQRASKQCRAAQAKKASISQNAHEVEKSAAEQDGHLQSSRGASVPKLETATRACGFVLADGSKCNVPPPNGRRRCSAHKGKRIKPAPNKS